MSDVDSVPPLPAVLDANPNASAHGPVVTLNSDARSRQSSPKPDGSIAHGNGGESPKRQDVVEDGNGEPPSPKADSEAETIIQSGRESLSPEKRRQFIRHDPKRRDDDVSNGKGNVEGGDASGVPSGRKRKSIDDDEMSRPDVDTAASSPRRRETSPLSSRSSHAKTEEPQSLPGKQDSLQKAATGPTRERGTSRKRSFSESVEAENEPVRRVRSHHSPPSPRDRDHDRDRDLTTDSLAPPASPDRSVSPVRPSHKRTVSGRSLGATDHHHRKKRAPPPLLTSRQRHSSEDRQSVSSSASGSPLPSSLHGRKLGSADASAASPAKFMVSKKQRDQNGRTRLARACAAQEVEAAIAWLAERPEDLNVADNAGNTPLQIASLEGCAPIVKVLLEAGCEVETRNIDKDTPLIDAVENGHLDVVKLLLDAGANPRCGNALGDEPYELVPSDSEDYNEIRRVLADAKAHPRAPRRPSDDSHVHSNGGKEPSIQRAVSQRAVSQRASATSPRESPPVTGPRSPPVTYNAPRRKTVRSEITRNDLLWTKATPESLREFAAKGDMAGVANILNVLQKADTESLIAAAKGGHDEVLSLLFGMGDAEPDPEPVSSALQKSGYNTPMLAAIGRGNLAVIKLLLDQPGFDPTRRLYRDKTYFELSRERGGGEEEYRVLRQAYDNFAKTKRGKKPSSTSPRVSRGKDKESRRTARRESISPAAARPRKAARSPSAVRSRDPAKDAPPRDNRREGAGPPLKDRAGISSVRSKIRGKDSTENSLALSDADGSRVEPERRKPTGSGRRDSESSATTRPDDAPKRRRLIAGRPPQDREKRRASLLSSDSLSGREEVPKARPDGVKNGIHSLKRVRGSLSPERSRSRGSESERRPHDLQKKKRRVVSEDGSSNGRNGTKLDVDRAKSHPREENNGAVSVHKNGARKADPESVEKPVSVTKSDPSTSIKQESEKQDTHSLGDIPMEDAPTDIKKLEEEEEQRKREEAQKLEAERLVEGKRLAAEAAQARKAEEEAAEEAARLAREKVEDEERKRKEAEQRRIKQAEEERQKRLEVERLRIAKLRREQEEQEQRRRDALPSRLRAAAIFVGANDPRARSHSWLKKFMPVVTAVTKQLDPLCDPELADEKWVPNYLVAPLLATNDLQLSQYASWEKRHATPTQRMNLWRVTRRMLIQADGTEFHSSSLGEIMRRDCETRPKYFEMEHVFWVKLSDFMDLVPHVPHLNGLDIQFLRMHIDCEPSTENSAVNAPPQLNGANDYGPPSHGAEVTNGVGVPGRTVPSVNLANGFTHSRPSTYV